MENGTGPYNLLVLFGYCMFWDNELYFSSKWFSFFLRLISIIFDDTCEDFASFWQSKDAEVMLKLGSTADKREQHRLMRDAMEKRFVRVARGSIIGGVRLGMFTAAFYSLQNLLAEKRGVHDVFNVVAAGSATASTFGLISKNSEILASDVLTNWSCHFGLENLYVVTL